MTNISLFKPAAGYLLVKPQDTKSEKLLYVNPEGTPHTRGIVIAVGAKKTHESGLLMESEAKVGQKIIFNQYRVDVVYLKDIEYLLIPFENLRGIYEK